jgi:hypothetical protein
VSRSSLSIAFLAAVLLHLAALTAVSSLWEPLGAPAPTSHLIPAELVAVEPAPQPMPSPEPEEITPPVPEPPRTDPTPDVRADISFWKLNAMAAIGRITNTCRRHPAFAKKGMLGHG